MSTMPTTATTIAIAPTLPDDLAERLRIAALVAEDLWRGDWVAVRLPACKYPAVARLTRLDKEDDDHTLALIEGRLCIAVRLRRGLVADEQLTAVFQDVAEELFPEISQEQASLPVPVLDLLPQLPEPASPEQELAMLIAMIPVAGGAELALVGAA
jgi:hypothetical protein